MRVLYISMVYPPSPITRKLDLEGKKKADTEMIRRQVTGGTPNIESRFEGAVAAYYMLKEVDRAVDEGVKFDAIQIGCMADIAAEELREFLAIPVLGPLRTAIHLASMLAHNFSIVTVNKHIIPQQRDLVYRYGFRDKVASFRHINSTVKELQEHIGEPYLTEKFVRVAKKCIEEDGAEVIIPGCGAFSVVAEEIEKALAPDIYIDTTEAEIRMLELLHEMGLKQSKRSYPEIPIKKRTL